MVPGYKEAAGARSDATPEWWLQVGPPDPGGRQRGGADSLSGQEVQLPVRPARRRGEGPCPPEALKGKIALVGASAHGLQDLRATPVDSVFPGVEIHANLIAGILGGTIKEKPAFVGAEVVLLLGGLTLAILIPMLSALWATLATTAGLGVLVLFNRAAWTRRDGAAARLALLMAQPLHHEHGVRLFRRVALQAPARRALRRVRAARAGRPHGRGPGDRYNMAPSSAELTILFADVRGFTGISEALKPEELREYINEYLTEMSTIIRGSFRGTLDKYIGDAIMAFWGAPVDDPQHARNAVLAALEMQRECAVLNARFAARGWPALRIGVGVNSGTVRVGDMGSRVRRAYTAMGDAVNVASRLEGRTKSYGGGRAAPARRRAAG